jgi:hypothetical protein
MAIKVNDGDGTVGTVDRSQQGQGDGVVSAKRDDSRQGFTLDCRAPLVRICRRRAREDLKMTVFNLLKSPSVVVPL